MIQKELTSFVSSSQLIYVSLLVTGFLSVWKGWAIVLVYSTSNCRFFYCVGNPTFKCKYVATLRYNLNTINTRSLPHCILKIFLHLVTCHLLYCNNIRRERRQCNCLILYSSYVLFAVFFEQYIWDTFERHAFVKKQFFIAITIIWLILYIYL